ncbi:hypothetical protein RhiirC2_787519 [Rhizophagus irregularis]|uniref:Uncharacterized protein n=1 Tax=Rhizophagus irregularis TaxID=588596 RepID=A0A2N1MS17_9GLOM|nr:hypothetical protein RhiirC2_787519 [Rhizophagus irregularis]
MNYYEDDKVEELLKNLIKTKTFIYALKLLFLKMNFHLKKITRLCKRASITNTHPISNQLQISKDGDAIKKRNYNNDYLLIHLCDTLHCLRDDETWFQEIIRRTKELLKVALNITPENLIIAEFTLPLSNNRSILSLLAQVLQSLSFKYPVAPYYVDWRVMLSGKKLGEMAFIFFFTS